eukprot:CAMPEP_0116863402 /NCGR_PEP_ID=MMETSP0418-20121206/24205_1 /TAXON_ID=1158023 /ORGANISM="Astrosyne radiata, Strain 13vi08-1A" /LENGTH=141 /DNA_ID=CAMNT_0004498425 /DNA_START=186 /DNA_END=611 /DNA_ORIENTATION=+
MAFANARTRKTKRRVRFAPGKNLVSTRETISLSEYTRQDLQNAFHGMDELARMKCQAYGEARLITFGACFSRGLESRTLHGRKRLAQVIRTAVHAVLQEQEIQRYEGIRDPYYIAQVYGDETYRSQIEARRRGSLDEKMAW